MLENIIATEEIWLIAGLALLAIDILLINSYVLMWFGVGALVTGAVKLFYPEIPLAGSIVLMAVVSLSTLIIWVKVLKPRRNQPPSSEVVNQLIGTRGLVSKLNPVTQQGKLRLQAPIGGHDVWDFEAPEGCKVGDTVEIKELSGTGKILVSIV